MVSLCVWNIDFQDFRKTVLKPKKRKKFPPIIILNEKFVVRIKSKDLRYLFPYEFVVPSTVNIFTDNFRDRHPLMFEHCHRSTACYFLRIFILKVTVRLADLSLCSLPFVLDEWKGKFSRRTKNCLSNERLTAVWRKSRAPVKIFFTFIQNELKVPILQWKTVKLFTLRWWQTRMGLLMA